MKAFVLHWGLIGAVLAAGVTLSPSTPAVAQHPEAAQASYVRICKDRRGMKDRRACGGKDDPRRTVLASN